MADSIAKFFDIDVKPPRGGFRVVIEGREFAGNSESEVFNEVKRWRQNNDTFTSDTDVERAIWDYWRANEPNRHTSRRMPSFSRMAVNAAKAVVRTAVAAVTGQEVVAPKTQAEQRLAICRACPRMVIQDSVERCSACGCYLNYKTALSQEKCPLGKW